MDELNPTSLEGGIIAFTGRLASMKRAEAFTLVTQYGGKPRQRVSKETTVLIVGELGWPLQEDGRPSASLESAKTYGTPIVSERRFLRWTGKSLSEEQVRTYTANQIATLSKLPAEIIQQISVFGLIEAEGGRYGFRDLAAARQVAHLLDSGVPLSGITRSLAEIRKWLPEARLSNLRLFPESSDRILVEQAHGRTDLKGQFVLPVTQPKDAEVDDTFAQARCAEEAGDTYMAESLYRRVMKLDPDDPTAGFNLGNLLRGERRLVEAEAAYRWAVKADPRYAPAWHNLADLLDESGRLSEAVNCQQGALSADPDYADAMFNMALLLQRLGRHGEAAAWWGQYLEHDRTSSWADRAKRALKYCQMQMTVASPRAAASVAASFATRRP